jgi:tRNA A37 threonylcarbamoyladenosine modification protein TsaB
VRFVADIQRRRLVGILRWLGAAVLGVDTLWAIAAGLPSNVTRVSAAIDAQRGDVVAQSFSRKLDMSMEPAGPQELLSIDAWLARLTPGVVVAGRVL